jgi:hypothetical protein
VPDDLLAYVTLLLRSVETFFAAPLFHDFAIAFGILFVTAAPVTLVAWLVGTFNPVGYLGVLPWRVPRCWHCGRPKGTYGHHC